MKKTLSLIIAVIMVAGVMIMPMSASASSASIQAGIVETVSGNLNIRSGASTSSSIITSIARGSYVTLISKSGSWWYVEYGDGKYGYCHADFIRIASGKAATVSVSSWSSLNVRSGAGASYSKIDSLYKGDEVVIISSSGAWSKILYSGNKTGYVHGDYLKVKQKYPQLSLSVPSFKQYDSRWASVKIGTSGKTIGQIGCVTTGIAMMESYRTGATIYPDTMAKRLSYDSSGNVYWPSDYKVVTSSAGYLEKIYAQLQNGKPVLIGAKKSNGSQHWAVITGYAGGDTLTPSGFIINDPGSSTRTNLQQLFDSYPTFYKFLYY